MTVPVPGKLQGTKYGARGSYWSCRKDKAGNGIHTGVDYPAPVGTKVVAARPGKAYWVNHGSAFGNHQVEVRCGDGTRDFYAHMSARSVSDGQAVVAGQQLGKVGQEGNVTGPHLHFERHATETGGWSCTVVRDPAPSVKYAPKSKVDPTSHGDVYVEKLVKGQKDSDSVAKLRNRLLANAKIPKGQKPAPHGDDYGKLMVRASKYWQTKVRPKVAGPKDGTSWSNAQANAVFGTRYTVHKK